jgi:RNA polymerase sigma-70 factor (ECF subfamily)
MLALQTDLVITKCFEQKLITLNVEELYKQSFDKYFDGLYHYAYTIVKETGEAKDIVQAAFIKLWEKRNEVNMNISAKAYLYTSVYNLSLNAIRNRKTREEHHQQMRPVEFDGDLNSAEQKETRARIDEAIENLPERCREVFCKSRFEGKKYAEIAAELDISVKTVEGQVGKALGILRKTLSDLAMIPIIYFLV